MKYGESGKVKSIWERGREREKVMENESLRLVEGSAKLSSYSPFLVVDPMLT